MYKLEERVLFDAALPIDIANAADAVESTEQDASLVENDVEVTADFIDAYNETADDVVENEAVSEVAELVDSLTETPDEVLSNELYIVDTSVPDYQTLVLNIPEGAEVQLLDVNSDGIQTISDILEGYDDLDAVHILSHGSKGSLRVGDDIVTNENLSVYADEISQWNDSLSDGADILLYGCNLAETTDGKQLVASVSALTNADVAASTNSTGVVGGWELEYQTGSIEAITVYAKDYGHNLADAPIVLTVDTATDNLITEYQDTKSNDTAKVLKDPEEFVLLPSIDTDGNGLLSEAEARADDGKLSLSEALYIAKSTASGEIIINFHKDILDINGKVTIDSAQSVDINSDITLTIDGDFDNDRIEDVTIINSDTNTTSENHGFMSLTKGNVSIEGVVFKDFVLREMGGPLLHVKDGELNISYSTFTGISTNSWAGSIIKGDGASGNTASENWSSTVNINWTEFIGNTANTNNGMLWAHSQTHFNIKNSYFSANSPTGDGLFRNQDEASAKMSFTNTTVDAETNNLFFISKGEIEWTNSVAIIDGYFGGLASKTIDRSSSLTNVYTSLAKTGDTVTGVTNAGGTTVASLKEHNGVHFIDIDGVATDAYDGMVASNTTPTTKPIADQSFEINTADGNQSYDISGSFTDSDGVVARYELTDASGNPVAVTGITIDAKGMLVVDENLVTPQAYELYIVGVDNLGKESAPVKFALDIKAANIPPKIEAPIGDRELLPGNSFDVSSNFSDSDGGITSYSIEASDPLTTDITGITVDVNGLITVDSAVVPGDYTVVVKASDGSAETPQTFTITVQDIKVAKPVEGGTVLVTTKDDQKGFEVDTAGVITEKTFADSDAAWNEIKKDGISLREAIWFTGKYLTDNTDGKVETITFDTDLFTAGSSIVLDKQIVVDADIHFTIDGNIIDDGVNADVIITSTVVNNRFMYLKKGTVTIEGLKIDSFTTPNYKEGVPSDAKTEQIGGTILVGGGAKLSVTHSVFSNNIAGNQFGAASALYVDYGGSLNISWTEFENNRDNGSHATPVIKIAGSTSTTHIENSFFLNNSSKGHGLIQIFQNSKLTVENTTFINKAGETDAFFNYRNSGSSTIAPINITTVTDGNLALILGNSTGGIFDEGTTTLKYTQASAPTTPYELINGVRFIKAVDGSGDLVEHGAYYGALLAANTEPELNPGFNTDISYESGSENPDGSFPIMATGNEMFIDKDSDPITLSVAYKGGVTFPAGITYDAATQTFKIDKSMAPGDYIFIITANDGLENSASEEITFKVTRANEKPTAPGQSLTGSDDISPTTIISGPVGSLLVNANDPDGDNAKIYISEANSATVGTTGATFDVTLSSGDIVSVTVFADGSYKVSNVDGLGNGETATGEFSIVIKDELETRSASIKVSITITGANDVPAVVTQPSDVSGAQGGIADTGSVFSDIDGDALKYSLVGAVGDITIDENTGAISIGNDVKPDVYKLKITATDPHSGSVTTKEFILTVTSSPKQIFVTTGEDDNDSDGYTYAGESVKDLVNTFGADGLSLREAVWIANNVEGKEIINFTGWVNQFSLDSTLTVSSDVDIIGNGATSTILQFNNKNTQFAVSVLDGKDVNVSVSNLRISGNLGNESKDDDAGGTSMVSLIGKESGDSKAAFAKATFENVEIVDHYTINSTGGAFYTKLAHLSVKNSYIANIASKSKNTLTYSLLTKNDFYGVTIDNLKTAYDENGIHNESAKYAFLAQLDNRDNSTKVAMSDAFKASLGNSFNYITFNNILQPDDGNGNVSALTNRYLTFQTDAIESHFLANIVVGGDMTNVAGKSGNGISYTGDVTGDANSPITSDHSPTKFNVATTHNTGVRYYSDGFDDAGADSAALNNAPELIDGASTKVLHLYDAGNPETKTYNLMSGDYAMFKDLDGDSVIFTIEYQTDGMPAGISFSKDGTFTIEPGTADGTYRFIVRADDGKGGVVLTEVKVQVNDMNAPNTPPVFTPVEDDGEYLQTIDDSTAKETDLTVATWEDLQGSEFDLSSALSNGAALPNWLVFDAATGKFTIINDPDKGIVPPANGARLSIVVTAQETDSDEKFSSSYLFTLIINHAPKSGTPGTDPGFSGKPVESDVYVYTPDGTIQADRNISNYFIDSDSALADTLTFYFSDADGNIVDADGNPILATGFTLNSKTGQLIIDENQIQYGDTTFTVRAQDQYGAFTTHTFTFSAEGPVIKDVEVGSINDSTFKTGDYFTPLGADETATYDIQFVTASGSTTTTLPRDVTFDSETGELSVGIYAALGTNTYLVTRTKADGTAESRTMVLTFKPSTTAIIIDDVYVARNRGTVADALRKAIADAQDGQTIFFNLSDQYVNSMNVPLGYNRDFDGDGDSDIYLTFSESLLIDKSLTIVFDTDGKAGDRDVIIHGGGLSIEGRTAYDEDGNMIGREAPEVNLSQFAVVNASIAAIYHNSAVVTITDADFANGNVAYYVDAHDRTSSYVNKVYLTNINIYGNNTSNKGLEYDQSTIHAGSTDEFVMTNAFMGSNRFTYGLIRGDGKTTFNNVTIANNERVGTIRGRFINGGIYNNVTVVDNKVTYFKDYKGKVQVPDFINGVFSSSLIAGNTMSFWIDDLSANTPDSVKELGHDGLNITVLGSSSGWIVNTYTRVEDIVGGEESDVYLNNNVKRRTFAIIDGVIHYVDTDAANGVDLNGAVLSRIDGSFRGTTDLAAVLEAARRSGGNDLIDIDIPQTSIIADDKDMSYTYDKYTGANHSIDADDYFIPLEDDSIVTYKLKILLDGDGQNATYADITTFPQGFSFVDGVLTFDTTALPGTYQFLIEATEDVDGAKTYASKAFSVSIKNNAPERTPIPAQGWTAFTRGDLGSRSGYDLGTDSLFGEDSQYFNDRFEDGKFDFIISGVTLNGRRVSADSFMIVDGKLMIADRLLDAGNYQISVKAVDSDGGVSNKPLVVSLNVNDDGRVYAADGGTIVVAGNDSDNTSSAEAAFNSYNGSHEEKLQAAWIALQQSGISLREAVWFAQKNGGGSDLIISSNSLNRNVNLSSSLVINTNVRLSNINIIGKAGQIIIGHNGSVSMTDISFSNFSTGSAVIQNYGSLSMRYIEFVDNANASALIASNGSTTLENVTALNNNSAGVAFAGAIAISNSTIIRSGNTGLISGITSVITDESNLFHDPATGLINIVTRQSGVRVLNDNVIGAGADEGLHNLPTVSVSVKDRDGYELGFGERSQIIASPTGPIKGYYWFVGGVLDSSQSGSTYVADITDAGKSVVLKYVIADNNGFMKVNVVTVGTLSSDTTAPDAPVVDDNSQEVNDMDATPEFAGTAPANTRVELLITSNGAEIERTVVLSDINGNWAFEANYLYGGTYNITALALSGSSIESTAGDNPSFEFEISPNARDENPMQGLSPVVNSAGHTAAPNVEAPELAGFDQDGDDLLAGEDVESDTDEFDEFVEDMTGDEGSVAVDGPTIIRSAASKLQLRDVATIVYGESNVVVNMINSGSNGSDVSIEAHVNNIFNSIDANNDGVLDSSEVPSNDMINFNDLDIDGDGEIDAEELREFIEDYDGDKDVVKNLLEGGHTLESAPKVGKNFKNSVQKALTSLFTL